MNTQNPPNIAHGVPPIEPAPAVGSVIRHWGRMCIVVAVADTTITLKDKGTGVKHTVSRINCID